MAERTEINLYSNLSAKEPDTTRARAVAAALNIMDAAARGGLKGSMIYDFADQGASNPVKTMADKIQEALKVEAP